MLILLASVVLIVSIVAVKCEQEEDDFAEFDDDFEEDELSRARNRREKTPSPPKGIGTWFKYCFIHVNKCICSNCMFLL